MRNVVIWGAGGGLNSILNYFKAIEAIPKDYIIAIVDRDKEKQNLIFSEIKVISPFELKQIEFDYICISSDVYYCEIEKDIITNCICDASQILNQYQLKMRVCVSTEYRKRYVDSVYNKKIDYGYEKNKRTIIYSAIIGNYDDLKTPLYVDPSIKYICFTNNIEIKSDIWDIKYISDESLTNVQLARKIKIMPYKYLDIGDDIIWVDAKYQILSDLRDYVAKYKKMSGMLCFPHFIRNNICDEMTELIRIYPEMKQKLIRQTGRYLLDGFCDNYGLFDTGCLYRDFSSQGIYDLMNDWWENVKKYTHRDQISFPYVCWKNSFHPDICDLMIEDNIYLKVMPHLKR